MSVQDLCRHIGLHRLVKTPREKHLHPEAVWARFAGKPSSLEAVGCLYLLAKTGSEWSAI